MKNVAIIVAAGMGKRMGGQTKKQYLFLGNKPLIAHTLMQFELSEQVSSIVLVVPEDDLEYCESEVVERYEFKKINYIIPGGKERQDSVRAGLEILDPGWDFVIIHDGVRPFVTPRMIGDSIKACEGSGACVVAVPCKDTVKEVSEKGEILRTVDRKRLRMVQTPQVFKPDIIKEAHSKAFSEGFFSTDDSALVERLGYPVTVVEGSYENIKITTEDDLRIAEAMVKSRGQLSVVRGQKDLEPGA